MRSMVTGSIWYCPQVQRGRGKVRSMAKGGVVVHLQKDRQVEKLGQRYHSVVLLLLKGGMVLLPLRYDGEGEK